MSIKRWFSHICDSVGDGSGITDLTGNFEGSTFKVCPPVTDVYYVTHFVVMISDSSAIDLDSYGVSLSTGIDVCVMKNGVLREDLTPENIMSVKEWGKYTGNMTKVTHGLSDQIFYSTWEFRPYLRLNGGLWECLQITLDDDFSGLTGHTIVAHGYSG